MSEITVEIIANNKIEIDFANPVFENHNHDSIYYREAEVNSLLNGKQGLLISGSNIKTINNTSLLGSGNIEIEDIGGGVTLPIAQSDVTNLSTDLGNKVDKVAGKGLSANDFTNTLKSKLDGIQESANNYTHPANHLPSIITQDANNRFVTDTEKSTWNAKSNFSGSYTDLSNKPTIPSAQVNSDWNSASGVSQILNKPSLFSGSYTDLTDKPTIASLPIAISDVTDLTSQLSGKSATNHNHNLADLTEKSYNSLTDKPTIPTRDSLGLDTNDTVTFANLSGTNTGDQDLSGYSLTSHNHTGVYQPVGTYSTDIHSNITALNAVSGTNTGDQDLSGYSLTTHNHSLNNLTEKSYNSLTDKPSLFSGSYTDLSNKPTIPTALSNLTKDINFDERYYTETEIDTKIGDIETLLAAL